MAYYSKRKMQVFLESCKAPPLCPAGRSPQELLIVCALMAFLVVQSASATTQLSCEEHSQPLSIVVERAARGLAQVGLIATHKPPIQLVQIAYRDLGIPTSRALTAHDSELLLMEMDHYDTRSFYLQISVPLPNSPVVIMSANQAYILKADPSLMSITVEPVMDMASLDLENPLYHFRMEGPRNNFALVPAVGARELGAGGYTVGVGREGRLVIEHRKRPAHFTLKRAAIVTLPN